MYPDKYLFSFTAMPGWLKVTYRRQSYLRDVEIHDQEQIAWFSSAGSVRHYLDLWNKQGSAKRDHCRKYYYSLVKIDI